jgi:NDP-mannose synthase
VLVAGGAAMVDLELGVIEPKDGFVTDYFEKPTLPFDVSMGVYAYPQA